MSEQKLRLSEELLRTTAGTGGAVSNANMTEMLKNERASIEASSKVEVARLQVCKEALSVVNGISEVWKSRNQFNSTVAEWQGRITQAEVEVRKAEINLTVARENNKVREEELAQSRKLLDRILELFDFCMVELKSLDCSAEDKAKLRRELLEISDRLVQLKK